MTMLSSMVPLAYSKFLIIPHAPLPACFTDVMLLGQMGEIDGTTQTDTPNPKVWLFGSIGERAIIFGFLGIATSTFHWEIFETILFQIGDKS